MEDLTILGVEHIVSGFIVGIICFIIGNSGILPISNEFIGVIIGFLILYLLGRHSESRFDEKVGFGSWFMNGILPFYLTWMVTWIFLINYIII